MASLAAPTQTQTAPPLPAVQRYFEVSLYLLITVGVLAITTTGKIDLFSSVVAVLALGYAAWSSGQLESEIRANGWLHCPADASLVFDDDFSTKYDRALAKIGVSVAVLSGEAGRA